MEQLAVIGGIFGIILSFGAVVALLWRMTAGLVHITDAVNKELPTRINDNSDRMAEMAEKLAEDHIELRRALDDGIESVRQQILDHAAEEDQRYDDMELKNEVAHARLFEFLGIYGKRDAGDG